MMQYSESLPSPVGYQISSFTNLTMTKENQTIQQRSTPTRPFLDFPTSKLALGHNNNSSSLGDANCMEQLLVHCANAIENNDATLTQQILWVLNNIATPDGDSNQRLTCGFLRALIARAAKSGNSKLLTAAAAMANVHTTISINTHKFSIIELAGYVDLTPWHRFGFTAANAAIIEGVLDGFSVIHIVDLSLTHCMQIPTLIDAIATRIETPPLVKLTVAGATEDIPPMLDLSYEELGTKLVNFARSRNVIVEFRVIPSSPSDGFSTLIEQVRMQHVEQCYHHQREALIINCHMMLHYIPDETLPTFSMENCSRMSYRTMFLKSIRSLNPTIVVLVDEDADFTSNNLVARLRSAFNYLWIPYDTVDTFLPKGSMQRQWYEADICWKIENVIAQEGIQRVERLENKCSWVQRMLNAGFKGVGFSEDAVMEVKNMLDEHAAGWGMKKDEDDLVLTWKGHNVVFASVWLPVSSSHIL